MASRESGEESKRRILEVSEQLFLEKGYDDTSISDIVRALGMSKGVIYHHFNSKQDIFEHILQNKSSEAKSIVIQGNNGLEKLRSIISSEIRNFKKQEIFYTGRVLFYTPRLIGEAYLSVYRDAIPQVQALVDEGIKDGSIKTKFPKEVTEFLMIFSNLVIGLQLGQMSLEEAKNKFEFIKFTLDYLQVPLFDDNLMGQVADLLEFLKEK